MVFYKQWLHECLFLELPPLYGILSSHLSGSLLWTELCSLQSSYVDILTPVSENVILFGERAFEEVIAKTGH